MYRKDQIKGIIAIILFGIIGLSFWLFPDSSVPEYISIAAFLLWLLAMMLVNRKFEKKEEMNNENESNNEKIEEL